MIQVADAVYVGVDSRVISIGAEVADGPTKPKIHQVGDVVFAHAGIFKDTQGKLDVKAAAEASIEAGGDLAQVVDRFTSAIQPQSVGSTARYARTKPRIFQR